MKRMYTWAARPVQRSLTVADMKAAKGRRKLVQVTANTAEEAAAAAEADIDLIIGNAVNVEAVRRGNDELFLTAALGIPDYPTESDVLRAAFGALARGADAIFTSRSLDIVSALAKEEIPVMGHLGLVPRKSTWVGGLRAVGKTADEAYELYRRFRRLEEAGAFSVEAEGHTGAGAGGDLPALGPHHRLSRLRRRGRRQLPLHGRTSVAMGTTPLAMRGPMRDLAGLRRRIREERVRALRAFREDALGGGFPGDAETVGIDPREMEGFRDRLEREGG